MLNRVLDWFSGGMNRIDYSVTHMNMTQWGIVAVMMVFLGFIALRTRM